MSWLDDAENKRRSDENAKAQSEQSLYHNNLSYVRDHSTEIRNILRDVGSKKASVECNTEKREYLTIDLKAVGRQRYYKPISGSGGYRSFNDRSNVLHQTPDMFSVDVEFDDDGNSFSFNVSLWIGRFADARVERWSRGIFGSSMKKQQVYYYDFRTCLMVTSHDKREYPKNNRLYDIYYVLPDMWENGVLRLQSKGTANNVQEIKDFIRDNWQAIYDGC